MEITDDLASDEFEVLNAVASSVRANRLLEHRGQIIDNWRRKEILNMKKVISNLTFKKNNLKKKRKKLTEYYKTSVKDFERLLKVDVPIAQTALSGKYKVLSKKKALEKLKNECDEHLKRHTESWKRAELQWEEIPEVKKLNELAKKLETLKEAKRKIQNDQNNKKEKLLLSKKRFHNAVIQFAKGMSYCNKTMKMLDENRHIESKISDNEKKIKILLKQVDQQIEFRVEKELEKKNFQNLIGLDFDEFDSTLNIPSTENVDSIHDISMNEHEFDPDCTNLSLDMSTEYPLSLTIGTDKNLGTPIAVSTPLCAEPINHVVEHPTTSTNLTPPSQQESQNNFKVLAQTNLTIGDPNPKRSNEPICQTYTSQNNQFIYSTVPQLEVQEEDVHTVQRPTIVTHDNEEVERNEQANSNFYKNINQEQNNFNYSATDKASDVDYKEKYAMSPDDQSILCEDPDSPPVRLPTFNSYKPSQAASNLMSFFDFGSNKQQKSDAPSILDMF